MEFVISENSHPLGTRHFRGNSRHDTLTDVRFLNQNTVVCANREHGKLYLVEFEMSPFSCKIIDSINVKFKTKSKHLKILFENKPQHIDLFTIKDDHIYIVTLENTIGILKIENNKIVQKEQIIIPKSFSFHGIEFHPINKDIVFLSSTYLNPKLVVYNIKTRCILDELVLERMEGFMIKGVAFPNKTTIAVSATNGHISSTNINQSYDSGIGIYDIETFKFKDFISLRLSHTDDITTDDIGNIYICCQGDLPENILRFKVENDKLVQLKGYKAPLFPHGISIKDNIGVCTSYKNSSLYFFNLHSQ